MSRAKRPKPTSHGDTKQCGPSPNAAAVSRVAVASAASLSRADVGTRSARSHVGIVTGASNPHPPRDRGSAHRKRSARGSQQARTPQSQRGVLGTGGGRSSKLQPALPTPCARLPQNQRPNIHVAFSPQRHVGGGANCCWCCGSPFSVNGAEAGAAPGAEAAVEAAVGAAAGAVAGAAASCSTAHICSATNCCGEWPIEVDVKCRGSGSACSGGNGGGPGGGGGMGGCMEGSDGMGGGGGVYGGGARDAT